MHRKTSVDTFQKCLQPIRFVMAIALPTQKMTHKWNDGHQESFAIEIKKRRLVIISFKIAVRRILKLLKLLKLVKVGDSYCKYHL